MVAIKPKSIYTVKGRHPKITSPGHEYAVEKWNTEGELLETYFITDSPFLCTCYAGAHVSSCRHKQMLGLFKGDNLLDSGKFYMFDKKAWYENSDWGAEE